MAFCQSCGSEMQGNFCTKCGARNNNVSAPVQTIIQQVPQQAQSSLTCPRCQGHNITVQIVEDKIKTNHTSCLRGLGRLLLVICTLGIWLLVPKRKENSRIKHKNMAVCQNCGHSWQI